MHEDVREKLESRIDKSGDCWVWIGYVHKKDGYGRYRLPGMKWDKTAHRIIYELYKDMTIPNELTIDHLCLNKVCVNPEHLEIVSRSENSRRARLVDSVDTKLQRIKNGFNGGYNGDYCKRGHELESVNWANGQRRVCRKCHLANNTYSNKKLPIEQRVF